MKVIDALKLIEIDVSLNKRSVLGNDLIAELYWSNQRIDFEKESTELTYEEYVIIQRVYIPKSINKRTLST